MNNLKNTFRNSMTGGLLAALGMLLLGLLAWPTSASAASTVPMLGSVAADVFRWRPFLAPFHSVVLHFPIGFITIAFVLEVYYWLRPSDELRKAVGLVLILSWITGIIAAAFGLMRANSGEYDPKTLEAHRWAGLTVASLTFVLSVLHWSAFRKGIKVPLLWTYRFLLLANIGALMYAGHQGGNLTHGSNYLVKNAPVFIKEIMQEETLPDVPVIASNGAQSPEAKLYLEKVQPLLQEKCYSCHGPDKQKGSYRLDQRETALKGGESGEAAIKPGDPMQSRLVKLILLPKESDDIMPPSGKATLSADDILTIIRWIQGGARFGDSDATPTPVIATNAPAAADAPAANGPTKGN